MAIVAAGTGGLTGTKSASGVREKAQSAELREKGKWGKSQRDGSLVDETNTPTSFLREQGDVFKREHDFARKYIEKATVLPNFRAYGTLNQRQLVFPENKQQ